MKNILRFLFVFLFFIIATPAFAMTARGGQSVYIPKGEVVNGTLFAGGNSVTIDGTVHGDVFCGSQSVVISGIVDGDVICVAQSLRISGTVAGSVRAAGQTIEIAGPVKRNVTVMGQSLAIDPTGIVSGEILVAAQQFTDNGPVALSVTGATDHAFIDAKVGGDVHLNTSSLTLGDNAKIAGSVKYESSSVATLAPSATIAGTLTQTVPKITKEKISVREAKQPGGDFGKLLVKIIIYIVLAAIITSIAPKRTKKILDVMKELPMATSLTGFLTLIVVPVIIIALAITIVGIPFALILGVIYAFALALSRVFAAILVGEYLFANFHGNKNGNMLLTILLGVTVTWIVFSLPILGGIAGFLAVIWGLGAIIQTRK